MTDNIADTITEMNEALQRAAAGQWDAIGPSLLKTENDQEPLDLRLNAFNLALMQNLVDNVENNHDQIMLTFDFARLMTFFGNRLTTDMTFWSKEQNDDLAQSTLLLLRAQNGVETIIESLSNEQALPYASRQKALADDFNLRNQRLVDGRTLYDASEKPALEQNYAESLFSVVRERQRDLALDDAKSMLERGAVNLKRAWFITTSILPFFEAAEDPAASVWTDTVRATLQDGLASTAVAATALHSAARHHAFPARFDKARQGPSAS